MMVSSDPAAADEGTSEFRTGVSDGRISRLYTLEPEIGCAATVLSTAEMVTV